MTESENHLRIQSGLARIRFLRRALLVIILVFAPLVYVIAMQNVPMRIVMIVGISWICLGVIIELVLGFTRCPACRGYFHVKGMSGSIFAKKCLHCGVSLKGEG